MWLISGKNKISLETNWATNLLKIKTQPSVTLSWDSKHVIGGKLKGDKDEKVETQWSDEWRRGLQNKGDASEIEFSVESIIFKNLYFV